MAPLSPSFRQTWRWATLSIALAALIACVSRQGVASPAQISQVVTPEVSSAAPADELARLIEATERAYTEVSFAAVADYAERAMLLGRATSEQTCRLHVLLGIAKSALGQEDEARNHFTTALAIDPKLGLDRNLSPKLRAPYLEAKGYWEREKARLALTLRFGEVGSEVACKLVDPAKLVKKVRVWVRAAGEANYESLEFAAQPSFELHPHTRVRRRKVEYHAVLQDIHGNTLLELGEAARPLHLSDSAIDAPLSHLDLVKRLNPTDVRQTRSYWFSATLGVAAIATASMGVYFNVRREALADEWNGKECERPGATRLQQCGDVDERRKLAERMALGFYGAGGLLLVGSLGTWLFHGSRESTGKEKTGRLVPAIPCDWILGGAWVECIGRF